MGKKMKFWRIRRLASALSIKLLSKKLRWLMSACQYPKTLSFDKRNPHVIKPNLEATLSDIDRFVFENFPSLRIDDVASSSTDISETFSIDPYEDIRRSMKTMVEAHYADASQPLDEEFMEELLLYYLERNEESMRRHVLRAFSNVTTQLCCSDQEPPKGGGARSARA